MADTASPYRRADGTARFGVRSEFTTPHGKLLRETSLPHGMGNSPTHFAPVETARFAACGRIKKKKILKEKKNGQHCH